MNWGTTIQNGRSIFIDGDTGKRIDAQEVCKRLSRLDDLNSASRCLVEHSCKGLQGWANVTQVSLDGLIECLRDVAPTESAPTPTPEEGDGWQLHPLKEYYFNDDTSETLTLQQVVRVLNDWTDSHRLPAQDNHYTDMLKFRVGMLEATKTGNEARIERYRGEVAQLQHLLVDLIRKNRKLRTQAEAVPS